MLTLNFAAGRLSFVCKNKQKTVKKQTRTTVFFKQGIRATRLRASIPRDHTFTLRSKQATEKVPTISPNLNMPCYQRGGRSPKVKLTSNSMRSKSISIINVFGWLYQGHKIFTKIDSQR